MIHTWAMTCALVASLGAASQPAGGPERVSASAATTERVRLVFSIDQGFGNGLVVNRDIDAARRICEAVKTLRPAYDVFLLFNPQVADKAALESILDAVVAEDVSFVLDVCSSDCQTLGTTTVQNHPVDGVHGVCIGVDDLARYKCRYGEHLAGVRLMELFSMDFTNRAVKTTNPEWNTAGWKLPDDAFFQPDLVRPFLRFARTEGMFVQFSDWHWARLHPWDETLKAQEAALRGLLGEFPGTVIVTYANNEPADKSVPRLRNWHEAVQPFVQDGAAAIGLSDQAWLREPEMSCPVEEVIEWAEQALSIGCRYIQFEPAWYFFKLPRGTFGRGDYRNDPKWQNSGEPLANFERLKTALMERR